MLKLKKSVSLLTSTVPTFLFESSSMTLVNMYDLLWNFGALSLMSKTVTLNGVEVF